MLFVVSKRERFLSQILHSDQLTDVEKANAVASLIEGERSVKDAMRWLVTQQSQSAAMEGLTPRQRTSTQIVAVILAKGENPFNNETRKQYGLAALW